MPHRSTIFRRELKLKDPEKYERMLDERRKKDKKQRAEMKRKIKEDEFTEDELNDIEHKRLKRK